MVLIQDRLDRLLLLGGDVSDDDMLVRRETEEALVDLGDLAEGRLELLPGLVDHATVLDESGEVPPPVVARLPAKVVDIGGEGEGASGGEGPPETGLDFGDEGRDAHAVDGVLDSGVLPAVREKEEEGQDMKWKQVDAKRNGLETVPVVALGREDGFGDVNSLLRRDESNQVTKTRVGGLHRAVGRKSREII